MDEAMWREKADDLVDQVSCWGDDGVYIADDARPTIEKSLRAAYADGLEEAAKIVERERYLGLPNIDATTRTVTVSYVHQWMQNKLTRIAAAIRVQATPETPPVSGDGGEGVT